MSLALTSTLPPAWTTALSSMYALVECVAELVQEDDEDRAR